MRSTGVLIAWTGAAILGVNLAALWEPWDADGALIVLGAILVVVGAILQTYVNLKENDDA